jgi:hypothetical protein
LSEMPLDFWPGRPRQRRRVAAESPFHKQLSACNLDVRAEVVAINRGPTLRAGGMRRTPWRLRAAARTHISVSLMTPRMRQNHFQGHGRVVARPFGSSILCEMYPRLAALPRCRTIACHRNETRRVESIGPIPPQRLRGYARRMRRRRPIRVREIARLRRTLEIAALLTTLATRQRYSPRET